MHAKPFWWITTAFVLTSTAPMCTILLHATINSVLMSCHVERSLSFASSSAIAKAMTVPAMYAMLVCEVKSADRLPKRPSGCDRIWQHTTFVALAAVQAIDLLRLDTAVRATNALGPTNGVAASHIVPSASNRAATTRQNHKFRSKRADTYRMHMNAANCPMASLVMRPAAGERRAAAAGDSRPIPEARKTACPANVTPTAPAVMEIALHQRKKLALVPCARMWTVHVAPPRRRRRRCSFLWISSTRGVCYPRALSVSPHQLFRCNSFGCTFTCGVHSCMESSVMNDGDALWANSPACDFHLPGSNT